MRMMGNQLMGQTNQDVTLRNLKLSMSTKTPVTLVQSTCNDMTSNNNDGNTSSNCKTKLSKLDKNGANNALVQQGDHYHKNMFMMAMPIFWVLLYYATSTVTGATNRNNNNDKLPSPPSLSTTMVFKQSTIYSTEAFLMHTKDKKEATVLIMSKDLLDVSCETLVSPKIFT